MYIKRQHRGSILAGEKKLMILQELMTIHLRRAFFLTICLSLLSGCAGLSEYACKLQESRAQSADLATHYRYTAPVEGNGKLSRGTSVKVMYYMVSFNVGRIEPCTSLSIIKEITLLRASDNSIQIRETREFYAEDGTLITSLTEDLTRQLDRSGQYTAVTPLPIPRAAPPGKYRILSRMTLEHKGDRRSQLLSTTEASFNILPRPKY